MTYKINPKWQTTTMGYPIDPSIMDIRFSPNQGSNYTSHFKTVQGVGVIRYGFDYIFNNHMYLGVAFETKFGFNDINAAAY